MRRTPMLEAIYIDSEVTAGVGPRPGVSEATKSASSFVRESKRKTPFPMRPISVVEHGEPYAPASSAMVLAERPTRRSTESPSLPTVTRSAPLTNASR